MACRRRGYQGGDQEGGAVMLERIVELTPAWDKRSLDPNKNYGIHGVELRMVLKGPEGAYQFVLYTNWQLPHVAKEFETKLADPRWPHLFHAPQPADVGYHAATPQYEGHTAISTQCPYVNGPCYYDGSGLQAIVMFDLLTREGSDGVWKELERLYRHRFLIKALLEVKPRHGAKEDE